MGADSELPVEVSFLTAADIKIGRFVTDLAFPTEDFLDPEYKAWGSIAETDIDEVRASNFQEDLHGSSSSSSSSSKVNTSSGDQSSAHLTSLIASQINPQGPTNIHIAGKIARRREVRTPRAFFEAACVEPDTKAFFERNLKRKNEVYMIIGFASVLDPVISVSEQTVTVQRPSVASSQFPPLSPQSPSADAAQLLTNTDSIISQQQYLTINRAKYYPSGEIVHRIYYRRIKFKRFRTFFGRTIGEADSMSTKWKLGCLWCCCCSCWLLDFGPGNTKTTQDTIVAELEEPYDGLVEEEETGTEIDTVTTEVESVARRSQLETYDGHMEMQMHP